MPRPRQLFVSHATSDRKFLEKLTAAMREHGLRFWHSRRDIRGAQQWHDEIGAALRKCDWFVLVLSPAATRSKWVKLELLYALQNDRYEKRIVPIVAKACDSEKLSWTLTSFQFVDFSRNFEQGSRELLRIWGIRYKSSASGERKRHR
jgi:hypothetical protein